MKIYKTSFRNNIFRFWYWNNEINRIKRRQKATHSLLARGKGIRYETD